MEELNTEWMCEAQGSVMTGRILVVSELTTKWKQKGFDREGKGFFVGYITFNFFEVDPRKKGCDAGLKGAAETKS